MLWVLASDVDGTLTGDPAALERLTTWARRQRAAGRLRLVLSTGRRLDEVLTGEETEGLPEPDAVISQVGTEIHLPPFKGRAASMAAWRERLVAEYSKSEATGFLAGVTGLVIQPEKYNTELKTSCWLDGCGDPDAAAQEIRRRAAGAKGRYQVVWSSSRDLDILPASAGKGKAVRFLAEAQGWNADRIVVAGDTGNDAAMLQEFGRGIVVANARPELIAVARELGTERVYEADRPYAAGVIEGLIHFGVMDGE